MTPKPKNFLSNTELLRYIHESKKTYGVYTKPEYMDYKEVLDDLNDSTASLGEVVRLMTELDVPPGSTNKRGQCPSVAFPPFRHYLKTETGWELVGKSQWKGDLHSGEFSCENGKITDELARAIVLMVERYGNKPNWRNYTYLDEMKGNAFIQLLQGVLKFNEAKSNNPFAYITTAMTNAFTRTWNIEKKHQNIRDESLIMAGYLPSSTYTNAHEHEQAMKRAGILTPDQDQVNSEEDK